MSTYSEQAFKEKITRLSLSQESIETLSLWILQHKIHAKEAVQTWLGEIQRASADKRLVLFYLANDILQNGRRRGADDFLELFQDPLRQAVTMIGGQKIQTSIERMFRIWKERRVYSNVFLKELELLIEPAKKTQVNEPLPDFKLPLLQDALSEFAKFQAELKVKSSHLSNLSVDISDPTASLSMLKDKSAGGRVSQQFEEASQRLQDYCECLGIEVNERINILDMLKECKTFTTYRLADLERTAADYKKLDVSVLEVKEKVEQRIRDLERANSTATSDPSAKEDITDVGDMEIESDGEGQADSQPETAKSVMSSAPGMLMSPPMSAYPDPRRRQHLSDMAPRGGTYAQSPLASNYDAQQALPPSRFPNDGFAASRHYSHPPLHRPPNRNQRPFPPRNPLPQRLRGRSPSMHRVASPARPPPFRGLVPRPPRPPLGPPPSVSGNLPQGVISSSPVLYTSTVRPAQPPGKQAPPSGEDADHASSNSVDTKKSLDERLKDLMMNNKFGNRILSSDSEADSPQDTDQPYSPSAVDPEMDNDMDTEEDRQSLPTPSDDSPVEESTPTPNMDNPILKVLYKSQASPEHKATPSIAPPSLVPDYDQEDDELSTSDLKNILNQVKSSEPAEEDVGKIATPTADDRAARNPEGRGVGTKLKHLPPSDIKITPSLTSLLDEIFPKISKSLINRKRKQDELPKDTNTKMPRPATAAPSPYLPSPQLPIARLPSSPPLPARLPSSPQLPVRLPPSLQSGPHPPAASRSMPPPLYAGPRYSLGARMPFPPPMKLPGEEFPRPFSSYEAARPLPPNHMHRMEGRFVRPPPPRIGGLEMRPRMIAYGDTRLYRPPPPGYRPLRPRYV